MGRCYITLTRGFCLTILLVGASAFGQIGGTLSSAASGQPEI
jgi:hypothetical protein